jgi:dipeptidyl aminopeptidase/acylaminoacyl peptidase
MKKLEPAGNYFLVRPFLHATVLVALLTASAARGQGTRADYERSANLEALCRGKLTHDWVTPHWTASGDAFWYRSYGTEGKWNYYWVDATKGTRTLAFDHAKLATAMVKATGRMEYPDYLPIEAITMGANGDITAVDASGNQWFISSQDNVVTRLPGRAGPQPSLPMMADCPASIPSSKETTITFVNRTTEHVQVFTVGFAGEPIKFRDIPSGKLDEERSYVGATWLITDAKGKRLGVFRAVEGGGDAVVGNPSSPTTQATTAPPATQATTAPGQSPRSVESPDGNWTAFVEDNNVRLRDLHTGREYQLSRSGKEGDAFDGDFIWSPDSTKLVALWRTADHPEAFNLIQSCPPDQVQPKLVTNWECRPGDVIASVKPHLFDIVARKDVPVSDKLFSNGLPAAIEDFVWEPDSRRFLFPYFQRGCQLQRIVYVDGGSGKATAIIEERSNTFLDGFNKFFGQAVFNSHEFIWMSERDGWNHLYLYDSDSGKLKNQITKGKWVVRAVDNVDSDKRQIWFEAGGLVSGQDPYYIHYCRINFDGTGLVDLSPGDGTHKITYSPDGRFYLDRYSRVDLPPVTELRRASDGTCVCPLEQGDMGELQSIGWKRPMPFGAKGRDGVTDIYGVIYRPMDLDPTAKYPVVEDIYSGPEGSWVPKEFTVCNHDMTVAELGFIVVQIDGMGTSNRSKAFQDVCWRNLGDAGLPDRVLWIKAAAARYPYMDVSRVGIYGGSLGGQNVLSALESFGDFYKVGVADCGLYDDRLFGSWWIERWMGWPVGPWYSEQSVVSNAAKMNGKLLLIACELDSVIDPASTMRMANALIKANKDFDLIVIPNAGHCEDGDYGDRRVRDFLVRNLLRVEPRSR